jgi:hypothetical protein
MESDLIRLGRESVLELNSFIAKMDNAHVMEQKYLEAENFR